MLTTVLLRSNSKLTRSIFEYQATLQLQVIASKHNLASQYESVILLEIFGNHTYLIVNFLIEYIYFGLFERVLLNMKCLVNVYSYDRNKIS